MEPTAFRGAGSSSAIQNSPLPASFTKPGVSLSRAQRLAPAHILSHVNTVPAVIIQR